MAAPSCVRWWVTPPGPDESLGSLVARAAAFFECTPQRLWANLVGGDTDVDWDDPPASVVVQLAQATGTCARQLQEHRFADAPWQLTREAREVYCPVCWAEQGGAVPVRLREWAGCLRTLCRRHGAPLVQRHSGGTPQPSWSQEPLDAIDAAIIELIDRFGSTLEGALFRGEPWPTNWSADAMAARTMLLRASFNVDSQVRHPPVADVVATRRLKPFIHGPIHMMQPRANVVWDDFRAIEDPAERRAALWLVAWKVVPGLSHALRPGWFPEDSGVNDEKRPTSVPSPISLPWKGHQHPHDSPRTQVQM